jgi:hypothetical protein
VRKSIAATLGLWFAIAPVHAALVTALSISFTFPGGTGNTVFDSSQTFALPKFSASLGTLNGVLFSVQHGPIKTLLTVDNELLQSVAIVAYNASAFANLGLRYVPTLLPVDLGFSQVTTDLPPTDPGGVVGADSDQLPDFSGSDIATFMGSIPLDILTADVMNATLLNTFVGAGNLSVIVDLRRAASGGGPNAGTQAAYDQAVGQLLVQYDFTQATPPIDPPVDPPRLLSEPPTWGLATIAMLIVAGLKKRRRSGPDAG